MIVVGSGAICKHALGGLLLFVMVGLAIPAIASDHKIGSAWSRDDDWGNKSGSIETTTIPHISTSGVPAATQQATSGKDQAQQRQETSAAQAQRPAIPPAPTHNELYLEFEKATIMEVKDYLKTYWVPDSNTDYKLSQQDIIDITVYEEPELSKENLRVSSTGKISLPLIGQLDVEGLSPRKVEKLIEKKYTEENMLKDPQVTVVVKEFKGKRVLILGAVNTPGLHTMQANERLMEMLAKAGGIKFDAAGDIAANKIRLLRTVVDDKSGRKKKVAMEIGLDSLTRGNHPESNLVMLDGDVVYVPEAQRFFVTGEVKNPGYYKIKDKSISVVEAITMAGGLTRNAAANRTRLVREENGKEVTLSVPVEDILDGNKSKDISVKPNDVIVVPQSMF